MNTRRQFLIATVALTALAGTARAQTAVTVEQPWARPTLGQTRISAAYMVLHAGTAADRLVGATSPRAARVELHTHMMENGVMQMRPVQAIEVSPGSPTVLQPGGLHIMIMDLQGPLRPGERLPLTLIFASGARIDVAVPVRDARGNPAPGPAPAHSH